MDKRLLTILRCPTSNKALSLAKRDVLDTVNDAISKGTLKNRDGSKVEAALAEALVTDDGKLLYPVDDGIPVLLEGESVALEQLHLYD
ncbi:MAG: hypothetical protein WBN09_14580 [Woeseiaceae bacterium]